MDPQPDIPAEYHGRPRRPLVRKTLLVLSVLWAFGAVRGAWETPLIARLRGADLLQAVPAQETETKLGRNAVLAILGGMRPLMAVYAKLSAVDKWEIADWDEVEKWYGITILLQPEDYQHRIDLAWHCAYNARAYYETSQHVPSGVDRAREMEVWTDKGLAYLDAAIPEFPDRGELLQEKAQILERKKRDPCAAAETYRLALGKKGVLGYVERFIGYQLAQCPGKEQEAYTYLRRLYDAGEKNHLPTLIHEVKRLERKLQIPLLLRIPDPEPDLPGTRNTVPGLKVP